MTTGRKITAEQVQLLLADRKIFPDLPEDLAEDTRLAIDSMGLVWFLHQLRAQYGLKVDPEDTDLPEFESVGSIVSYVNRVTAGG